MDLNNSKLLMNELKRLIKVQGYTYLELAVLLKMSESGFKKLINSKDCSLSKIEKICGLIGIRMADLFNSVDKMNLSKVSFTSNQENYFISNRIAFLIYWLLVYERRSLAESQLLLSLEEKKCLTILRKLDSLNLLKLHEGNRITLPTPQGIRWVGRSKFVMDLYSKWGHEILSSAIANINNNEEEGYFMIRYLKMCDTTWKEFKLGLEAIELKYSNLATREMRMNVENLKHIRWLSVVDQKSWVEGERGQVFGQS